MKWLMITPGRLPRARDRLLRFVGQHGEKRITRSAVKWLLHLQPEELAKEESRILAAVDQNRLAAFFAVSDSGRKEAFIVVHRNYRNRGIGKALTQRMCEAIPTLQVRVAEDNASSLRLFEAMGFLPYHRAIGPTGKPTLWLARLENSQLLNI